jgi:glutathione S-transferase
MYDGRTIRSATNCDIFPLAPRPARNRRLTQCTCAIDLCDAFQIDHRSFHQLPLIMSATKPALYYTPTSCGAASFIAANIAKFDVAPFEANIGNHTLVATGEDYKKINPKGNVPALKLPSGVLLNEGSAVLQYIADQNPASGLAPANGTVERYQLQNDLNFIATDLHAGGYGPLFNPKASDEQKAAQREKLAGRLDFADKNLLNGGKKFLNGKNLSVADIYLYIVLSWSGYVGVDLSKHANVQSFFNGIKALPEIQAGHAKIAEISASYKK